MKDRAVWAEAKERMQPSRDRIPWSMLEREYGRWRERGDWVMGLLWFGFEVTYSHMVGTPLFMAMAEDPEWVLDMVNTMLDSSIALLEMVWDAGYQFDGVMWYNDMGFKGKQFMSVSMYRDLFKPADRRAAEWAHAKGLPVYYHSCGNLGPLVPELIDAGVDMLNPLEVKAGMDPLALKAQYGDQARLSWRLECLAVRAAGAHVGGDGADHPADEGPGGLRHRHRSLRARQREPRRVSRVRGSRQGAGALRLDPSELIRAIPVYVSSAQGSHRLGTLRHASSRSTSVSGHRQTTARPSPCWLTHQQSSSPI